MTMQPEPSDDTAPAPPPPAAAPGGSSRPRTPIAGERIVAGRAIVESPTPPWCVVADDEPRLRQVLARLMTMEGFRCMEAVNGVEALDLLDQYPVSLLLSDLRMPELDGLELLASARDRYPDLAIVMITAVADVETAVQALSRGATDYLTKPFHLEEVRARVRQAMDKRRLQLENRDYHQQLETRVQEQAGRIEELYRAGIQALVDALEVKDRYTRGHSARVSQYATAIAQELGLEQAVLDQIELGGHVHDIGKIGVRETVLNKPSQLTPDEYRHVMTHPEVGYRLLAPLLADAPVALNVVLWHHERVDGAGLPHGLDGRGIPLEARIAAVADSFDAMTSARPYREGGFIPPEIALAELRRCAGTQFDAEVVTAFGGLIERGALVLPPHERRPEVPSEPA